MLWINKAVGGLPTVYRWSFDFICLFNMLNHIGLPKVHSNVAWGVTEKRGISQEYPTSFTP